jgi:hypothetical protein
MYDKKEAPYSSRSQHDGTATRLHDGGKLLHEGAT